MEEEDATNMAVPEQFGPQQDFAHLNLSEAGKKGELVYLRCRSCHTLEANAPHSTGPNLHGLFGAVAGHKEDYTYSDALNNSGITWTRETLDEWIEAPQRLIPGNKMAFVGIPNAEDRAALITYLEETTR